MAHSDAKRVMTQYYDLAKSPPTHDFVNWLARCEEARVAEGAESLAIRIIPGDRQQSPRDKFYSQDRRNWRINNLLTPLAWLLPSVSSVSVAEDGEQTLSYGHPGGPKPPCFKVPAIARQIVEAVIPKKAVTISLRDSLFEPQRNTDAEQWGVVADWIQERGYVPVIVPDAEADMEGRYQELPFFNYRAATYNPALRVALYEVAHHNLFICSGVQALAMYCDVKLHSFKTHVPGIQCLGKDYMRRAGWSPEHQWPGKRVFWEPDEADVIIPELEKFL